MALKQWLQCVNGANYEAITDSIQEKLRYYSFMKAALIYT